MEQGPWPNRPKRDRSHPAGKGPGAGGKGRSPTQPNRRRWPDDNKLRNRASLKRLDMFPYTIINLTRRQRTMTKIKSVKRSKVLLLSLGLVTVLFVLALAA